MLKISYKRLVDFFIIGIILGIVEDLIAIWLVTSSGITWHVIGIVILVAVPFAFFNEIIADHPDFWKTVVPKRFSEKIIPGKYEKRTRIIEFIFIGVFFGVIQDLIAILIATDAALDLRVIGIVIAVTIPFAFVSEMIVDKK